MRTPRRVVRVVTCVLVLSACSGGNGTGDPNATPAPADTPVATSEATPPETPTTSQPTCPGQDTLVMDDDLRRPGKLVGDLEGDGTRDDVFLVIDRAAEPGCQAFVVVDGDDEVRSAPIAVRDIPFEMGFPRLISLPLIDERPGAEIVVGVLAGASTQAALVYTVVDGEVVQVSREGATSPEENLLLFGGSVGHQEAFDCAPEVGDGVVVVSTAEPMRSGARFRYIRRFFVPIAPALVAEDESLREEGTVRFDRFDTLHEFPNAPFGSCPTGELAG